MRLRNIPGADDAILNSEYCIKNPEEQKGHWQDCFDKVQPLHIEIGMGKGRFIMDTAALHPAMRRDVLLRDNFLPVMTRF